MGRAMDPGLVRVAVSADGRRADLVLPSGMALIDLLPELLRRGGLLDASSAHRSARVLGPDGRPLDLDATLSDLGFTDGAALRLVVGDHPGGPDPRHDDLVDAVADLVADLGDEWGPDETRQARDHLAAVAITLAATVLGRSPATGLRVLLLVVAACCAAAVGTYVARSRGSGAAGARTRVARSRTRPQLARSR